MTTRLVSPIMLVIFVLVSVPFAIVLFVQSAIRRKARPPKPVTEPDIARAEHRLNFALPAALRAFFRERPTIRHDCAEPYPIDGAVREYRMVTKAPCGPSGRDWPRGLFPFTDLLPGHA